MENDRGNGITSLADSEPQQHARANLPSEKITPAMLEAVGDAFKASLDLNLGIRQGNDIPDAKKSLRKELQDEINTLLALDPYRNSPLVNPAVLEKHLIANRLHRLARTSERSSQIVTELAYNAALEALADVSRSATPGRR